MVKRSKSILHASLFPAACALAAFMGGIYVAESVAPTGAGDSRSLAQTPPGTTPTPFDSAGDRKANIEQLKEINAKLMRIEAKLSSGISVKVTEMPAVVMKDDPKASK